jgi:hypothetical protein
MQKDSMDGTNPPLMVKEICLRHAEKWFQDIHKKSQRISPTNFYALIASAAAQEHFYNPDEFWMPCRS